MNFIEKVDILNHQLVGDEDGVEIAYLEILRIESEKMITQIKKMNKERLNELRGK